jgi:hypothetical protein
MDTFKVYSLEVQWVAYHLCQVISLSRCHMIGHHWLVHDVKSHRFLEIGYLMILRWCFTIKQYHHPWLCTSWLTVSQQIAMYTQVNRLSNYGKQISLLRLTWEFDCTHINDQHTKLKLIKYSVPCTGNFSWIHISTLVLGAVKCHGLGLGYGHQSQEGK